MLIMEHNAPNDWETHALLANKSLVEPWLKKNDTNNHLYLFENPLSDPIIL